MSTGEPVKSDMPEVPATSPVPRQPDAIVREETRRQLQQIGFGVQVSTGPAPHGLIEKFQPEHVTQAIAAAAKENERDHTFRMTLAIIGVLAFIATCVVFLWWQKSDLLEKILALLIGFAGGFGVGKTQSKK